MAAVQRMTRKLSEERAAVLAKEAVELSLAGDKVQASRKLREAAALGHDIPDVQEAFLAIHNDQLNSPLLDLCRRYALYHDNRAGEEAVNYLRSPEASNADSVALECLRIILDSQPVPKMSNAQNFIIAELARQSPAVRQYIASELEQSTTKFFDNVYDRGDDAANCLRSVVLDDKLWPSEEVRLRVEDDLFQLFLAKLMESGHDHDGRALKGIALLLMADTHRLQSFIDEEAFEALMSSLDLRLPADVRGQATLVLSKFFEVANTTGQEYLYRYIKTHAERQKGDDLILAFSAAANLFPVIPTMMAQLFLTDGFLASIMPLLEKQSGSSKVHDAFLMLLNAACIDGACRTAIAQYCSKWLSHKVSNGTGKQPSVAATVLAKLRTSGVKAGDQRANKADDDVSELVDLFKKTLVVDEEGRSVSDSIEGLAYTSLKPEVKEALATDKNFLTSLLHTLEANVDSPEIIVGGLSILSNLTQYAPVLSEEQKKMSQLKAYANATKPADPSPLENDDHVRARCTAVVEAGAVATLTKLNKGRSPAAAQLTDRILLALSKNPKDRGKIAQQGAVKLLVSHAQKNLESSEVDNNNTDAAHALARVLISLNPAHVFAPGTTPDMTEAVPPLVALLKSSKSEGLANQPRDLLPVFEALLALTNLASAPEPYAANMIIKSAWDGVEDLLLGNNNMLRRAACELICNLTTIPAGAEKFADGSKRASTRLHILVAMADVDDLPTRRAAGGALAMLTEQFPSSVGSALLDLQRTPEIVLELCRDEDDPGVVHRGLVIARNLLCAPDDEEHAADLVQRARTAFIKCGAVDKLKTCMRKIRDPALLEIGVEALKVLVDNGTGTGNDALVTRTTGKQQ